MIEYLKDINDKISIKTKSMVLVFGAIFFMGAIFLILRYYDARNFLTQFQSYYTAHIQTIYNQNVEEVKKFYVARGRGNLNLEGINEAISLGDKEQIKTIFQKRWEVLKKENDHLDSVNFYSKDGKLITYFGKKPSLTLTLRDVDKMNGFCIKNDFIYRIFVQSKDGWYINFNLDAHYFLHRILETTGIEGYMKVNDKITSLTTKGRSLPFTLFLKNHKDLNQSIVNIKDSTYLIYKVNTKTISKDDTIQTIFFQKISTEQRGLFGMTLQSIVIVLSVGMFVFFILNMGFNSLINRLKASNNELENSRLDLKSLNMELERRVEEEYKRRIYNEQILAHQSKSSSVAEMVQSIARQWNQPLIEISSILSNVQLKCSVNSLTPNRLKSDMKEASMHIDFMTKSIDSFKKFLSLNKTKSRFFAKDCVKNALSLIDVSFKENLIEYKLDVIDDEKIIGYENEISQVILHILTNAKDIFLERKIKSPFIHITISKDDDHAKITIEDNAGGIEVTPIDKIFEPYFTTKHASTSAGISLYMCKIVIEKHSFGSLKVKNSEKGAFFTILL